MSDFIISNITEPPKVNRVCKLCGNKAVADFTDYLLTPYVCKACTNNNYIIKPELFIINEDDLPF